MRWATSRDLGSLSEPHAHCKGYFTPTIGDLVLQSGQKRAQKFEVPYTPFFIITGSL